MLHIEQLFLSGCRDQNNRRYCYLGCTHRQPYAGFHEAQAADSRAAKKNPGIEARSDNSIITPKSIKRGFCDKR